MLIGTNLEHITDYKNVFTHWPKIYNTMVKATLLVGVFLCLVICVTSTHEPVNNTITNATTTITTTPEPSNYINPVYARWVVDLMITAVSVGLVLVCVFFWGLYECCQKVGDHTSTLVQKTYPTRMPWHMRFSDSDTAIQPLLHRMIIDI